MQKSPNKKIFSCNMKILFKEKQIKLSKTLIDAYAPPTTLYLWTEKIDEIYLINASNW